MSDGMVKEMGSDVQCLMRREVGGGPSLLNDDLVCKVTKDCVTTNVSQFLICPCTFLRFQGLYDIVSNG